MKPYGFIITILPVLILLASSCQTNQCGDVAFKRNEIIHYLNIVPGGVTMDKIEKDLNLGQPLEMRAPSSLDSIPYFLFKYCTNDFDIFIHADCRKDKTTLLSKIN